MSERVLVTGASGFLGYHIIQSAIETGLEVYAAIRPKSRVDHLKQLPIQFIFLNYEETDDIAAALVENKIDYIIHAAGVTKAIREEIYNHVNCTYTLNIAKAAEKSGGSIKKMVFISSLAAVGPLEDHHSKILEATIPNPVTAYGRSKLLAEKGLTAIKLPVLVLRPTAIYGPRDRDIFIMLKTLSQGLDPYIGNFVQHLSFIHAGDVADVAVKSLFMRDAIGVYNITDGNTYTRYQLSDITKSLLNKKALRFHMPVPFVKLLAYFLETTNGLLKKPSVLNREKLNELAAKNWICDISKAKSDLSFTPKFDLQTGLEDSINWYINNKWLKQKKKNL